MACPITDNDQRKYPLKQPDDWQPQVPRWMLTLPNEVEGLVIAYIGVQNHEASNAHSINTDKAVTAIDDWLGQGDIKPVTVDRFEVISGRDIPGSREWACYWISKTDAEQSLKKLELDKVHKSLPESAQHSTGLWMEVITPDLTRFETNYSGDDYRPGISVLEGAKLEPHKLTGYWGAARDRIRSSAYDDFDDSDIVDQQPPSYKNSTKLLHLKGSNKKTIAHIRSGQFWENCQDEERLAYEEKLEPHLVNGLADIYKRPHDLGDYGLRFLRNLPPPDATPQTDDTRRETCAAGFSRSLAHLESWAKDCPSHHKIYGGAIRHKQKYGSEAKLRTWHEVAVLKPGEARWEYIGCDEDTGTIRFQGGQAEELYT